MLLSEPHNRTIGELAEYGDAMFSLPPGTSLTVLYHLLATYQIQADLFEPLSMSTRLVSTREAVLA